VGPVRASIELSWFNWKLESAIGEVDSAAACCRKIRHRAQKVFRIAASKEALFACPINSNQQLQHRGFELMPSSIPRFCKPQLKKPVAIVCASDRPASERCRR